MLHEVNKFTEMSGVLSEKVYYNQIAFIVA